MPRIHPHAAMKLVLRRLGTHEREVQQVDGGPTWVAHCPAHTGRSGMVRFDQHTNGTVAVHPHRNNGEIMCTPESIIAALAITDDRIRPYSRNGVGKAGDPFAKPARVRRSGEPAVDSHEIFERLKQALVDKDFTGPRGHPRYRCPACGAPGDGHGLHISHHPNASGTKRKILLVCHTNRCPPEEILEPLGMTLADICAGDDIDDLGDEDEATPGRITARHRPTPTITASTREYTDDGDWLLDKVHTFLCAYVAFPSEAAAVAVTLWAVHTHMVKAFDSTPRLALLSPEKQCGKSRTFEVLQLLCPGAETLSDASAAYLFRRIGAGSVTVLLDEADAIWRRGKTDETAEAIRSIVNAGHRKGATVGRVEMVGQRAELRRFPVYAPVALAGIGDCLPDTVLDRSVIVPMRRRAPDEHVQEYRERTARTAGATLRERLADWAGTVAKKVGDPWPEMPPGVTDRPADVWEPLLAVADLAGGDWPDRARKACTTFVTGSREDTASVRVRLLGDLLKLFRDGNDLVDAMPTKTILDQLHNLDEAPWADWHHGKPLSDRGLAELLRPYGVRSQTIRVGDGTAKGYRRGDLWDPWTRYGVLAGVSDTSVTSVTPLASTVTDVTDVTDTPATDSREANWPTDRRDQWRAEELIHRVFPDAVVIEEIEETAS